MYCLPQIDRFLCFPIGAIVVSESKPRYVWSDYKINGSFIDMTFIKSKSRLSSVHASL
jgi:hypothetical protein